MKRQYLKNESEIQATEKFFSCKRRKIYAVWRETRVLNFSVESFPDALRRWTKVVPERWNELTSG